VGAARGRLLYPWALGPGEVVSSVLYFPGLSRYFDCFDSILEWDRISGMAVVFDSLIFFGRFDCLISIWVCRHEDREAEGCEHVV